MPPMAYRGNRRANRRAVPGRRAAMPPAPVASSQPQSWASPRAQPPSTRGKVSQLGTLSFQPSMTAAAIMARQTNHSGQWLRMNCMATASSRGGRFATGRETPQVANLRPQSSGENDHLSGERGKPQHPRVPRLVRGRRPDPARPDSDAPSRAGLADLGGDVAEGVVGGGAQGRDGGGAHHADQGP